jgi:hypothetical protein
MTQSSPVTETLADKAEKCALYDFDTVEMVECKWALWQDIINALRSSDHAQTPAVLATEENIFDLLYEHVCIDNDGIAGMSVFVEDLLEKFDVRPKLPAVSDTSQLQGGK